MLPSYKQGFNEKHIKVSLKAFGASSIMTPNSRLIWIRFHTLITQELIIFI